MSKISEKEKEEAWKRVGSNKWLHLGSEKGIKHEIAKKMKSIRGRMNLESESRYGKGHNEIGLLYKKK